MWPKQTLNFFPKWLPKKILFGCCDIIYVEMIVDVITKVQFFFFLRNDNNNWMIWNVMQFDVGKSFNAVKYVDPVLFSNTSLNNIFYVLLSG